MRGKFKREISDFSKLASDDLLLSSNDLSDTKFNFGGFIMKDFIRRIANFTSITKKFMKKTGEFFL